MSIVLIFTLALILPASAADISDEIVDSDELAVDEPISENENTNVELYANETYGIYGNNANELEVYVSDGDGGDVTEGTVLFIDVFGKNYTAKVEGGHAKVRIFVGQTGQFNISCNYIGTGPYNNASTTLLLTVPVANTTCRNIIATKYDDTVYFTGNVVADYRPYKDHGDFDDFEEVTEGFVTVYVDGERLGTCDVDVNGNYVYIWNTTRNLTGQTINFTGVFANSKKHYNSSKFSKLFSFTPASDTRITYKITFLENGEKLIAGFVVDEDGKNVVGGTITINDNHSVPVDSNGTFKFYITNETPQKAQYEIGVFDWGSKADIRVNVPLMNAVEHTELTDKLIDLCTQGSPYIKFGNGNGKTVIVNVGTHGGELASQVAGFKLINLLANYGGEINGTIYVIPVVFPESTANNTRIYNGINLNTVADVNGSISNHVVKFSVSVNASGLGDFHNTRHGDSDVGITCVMGSIKPTPESQSIAKFIADETGYYLDIYGQAGVPYAGAIEDYCNILGIPAVTCESLTNHRGVEYGSPEMSYSEMRAFLRYFGFDVDEMQRIKLDDSEDIRVAFTSPYNYNPSLKNISDKTFTALQEIISNAAAGSTIELGHDYIFNDESDNGYIEIDKNDFTIIGNNHVIDGNRQSGIFNITGNNVTICDLTFKNGKSEIGGIIDSTGEVTLINVTFIANNVTYLNDHLTYRGGAIANYGGKINCYDSRFIDNHAESGSAIFIENGELNIKNTLLTSSVSNRYGQIWAQHSTVNIDGVDFINISSIYSPAISLEKCANASITNSRFINLTANMSAGAISLKREGNLYLRGCEFINTKSFRNAGAIIADYFENVNDTVTVLDCMFDNSSSMIGGAYVQLGGVLLMNASNFTNCRASYGGGAIYVSYTYSEIDNCIFTSNAASLLDDYLFYGGAIYCDKTSLDLNNSRFTNNLAYLGNAIYACDSDYSITNSIFKNNSNAIFTYFDKECTLDGNEYNNDSVITNKTYSYQKFIDSATLELKSLNNSINVANLPSRFDLRDWGWVTPVKNQGHMGSCWTFAMIGVVESALLKEYGVELDLSEENMMHYMLRYSPYGNTVFAEGGQNGLSVSYLVNWFGPIFDEVDIYDEVGKLSPLNLTGLDTLHVQDVIFVPNDVPGTSLIKSAIIKYGALDGSYYVNPNKPYYNPETFGYYVNESTLSNHEISIIGWDDTYSADNFLIAPPGDGAWIIKNSWGTRWGDNGFFYISYYDKSFLGSLELADCAVGIILENDVAYNKNYQHDFAWSECFTGSKDIFGVDGNVTYANQFEAADDDLIAGVGTYFNESGVNYTVKIYVNNQLKLTQNGVSPFMGYHTIKLNEYVPIKKGDVFRAVMTSNAVPPVICSWARTHYGENITFLYHDGNWIDGYSYGNYIACLKVYTVNDTSKILNNRDIAVDYDGGSYFSVNVATADGHNVAGAIVKFKINGKTTEVKTNSNGIAKIKITDIPKVYTIKTTYNGKTYTNKVTVKQILTANKVTVKKTAKSFTLKAKLKINGKLVKGKQITFKFKGKKYTVKTNAKGIAQKTFNKNVIKKLRKGKTYTVKVTYLKDTIKTTVKVR